MVFQSYALFPHMSLGENVGYGLKMLGIPRAEVKARAGSAGDGGSGGVRRSLSIGSPAVNSSAWRWRAR